VNQFDVDFDSKSGRKHADRNPINNRTDTQKVQKFSDFSKSASFVDQEMEDIDSKRKLSEFAFQSLKKDMKQKQKHGILGFNKLNRTYDKDDDCKSDISREDTKSFVDFVDEFDLDFKEKD